jgi:hypothetical protein
MVQSREELRQGGKEPKGKKKKHAPNNNGPREKYVKQIPDQVEGQPAETRVETADPPVLSRAMATVPADVPRPVAAPAPAPPVKRTKPKVVSF